MSSKRIKGIIDRGQPGRPRYYGVLRWPGSKSPRWKPLGGDYELAGMAYKEWKKERDDLKRYGIQKWEVFVENFRANKIADPKTIEIELWSLSKFYEAIKPQFLTELTPQKLLEAQSIWRRQYPGLSLNTIDTWKNRVITVAHWAEDRGYVPLQNWRIVKNLSKLRRKNDVYTQEQYRQVLEKVPVFSKECNAVMLAAEAGLRREEIYYACLDDIDLKTRIGEVRARDGWKPKMESDDRLRHYVISPALRDYLIALKKHRAELGNTSDYIYCDPATGKRPYGPEAITRFFVRISRPVSSSPCKRLGFRVSLHKFRHTYVTRLLDRGENSISVRNAARHKNTATTEIYDHTGIKAALLALKEDIYDYSGTNVCQFVRQKIDGLKSPNEKSPAN